MAEPRRSALRRLLPALGFIGPNLTLFLVFSLGPALFTLIIAFFRWDPFSAPVFVGFSNFNRLFAAADFWYYLFNTCFFMLGLPITMAGSLILALMLVQRLRGVIGYRTMFYLPTITSGVALFLLWKTMFNKEAGLINSLALPMLRLFGVTSGDDHHLITMSDMPSWLVDAWTIFGWKVFIAKPALIIMGVWAGIGGGHMILYIAALTNVPTELYEAAEIDGASRWRRFWDVTWPMIAPTTFFILVMGTIGGLQGGFEMAYLMTGGGPDHSTTTVSYFIFTKAFSDFDFGFASAIAFFLASVIMGATLLNWRFGSKAGGY